MKCYGILISILLAVVPVAAHDCHGYGHHDDGWHDCCGHMGASAQQSYAQQKAAAVEAMKGTVSEIRRPAAVEGITEAWLKTAGGTVLVRLGPAGFMRQNGVSLKEGDSIAVKGYRTGGSDDALLVVTEVEAAGKTVTLRSERGRPLW